MSPEPALRVVGPDHKAVAKDVAKGDLIIVSTDGEPVAHAKDTIVGLLKLLEGAGKTIGSLERRVQEDADPNHHTKGREIVALIERWKRGTGKKTAKAGAQRVKLIKSRLKDGYPITSDDWLPAEPTLELAVDGLCAFPYRVFDRRQREGKKVNLDNDLTAALKDEKHVEQMARLGYQARKDGLVTWQEENE